MQHEQSMSYFRTLYEVVKAVNSSLDPKTVLSQVADKARWAMGVKACSIRLLSEDRKYLLAGASAGLSQAYLRKGKVEVAKSVLDQEVLQGQNVYVCNACTDTRFQYSKEAQAEGIASVMAVPLHLQGREVIGVLRVYSSTERDFTSDEVEFLNAMADLCALAIHNSLAYDKVRYEHELLNRYTYQLFED
ncbi:GAF domain-containing protein [Desulfohalobium retbaense]|uniref:Phytochrome sensor protein n=1 Tax=Desulfohalobium retbaense (strain ATCC 49708 / DSM 5692 / JCM 16813 / HR100) TaxID=485915 RepID=C8X016_DESRD|nr:GAF domain-containing protein [Desulfohalobium retbaense]ACV67641.1 putative phytochrome sensor protein [Desulfohalobium retbaense DSM 5692]